MEGLIVAVFQIVIYLVWDVMRGVLAWLGWVAGGGWQERNERQERDSVVWLIVTLTCVVYWWLGGAG